MIEKWKDENFRNKQKKTRSQESYILKMKSIRLGERNPMFGKTITDFHKSKLILNLEKIRVRYPKFFKEEDLREYNLKIQCKCKYCSEWFYPSRYDLYERIRQVENPSGNKKGFLYCCKKHKYLCPYSNRVDPLTLKLYELYRRQVLIETNKNLKKSFISNLQYRGVKYGFHLDHKYSIIEGFKHNILPNSIPSDWILFHAFLNLKLNKFLLLQYPLDYFIVINQVAILEAVYFHML
jgi:hypothetical protein